MVAGAGAAYMVIENTGSAADFLVGGTSDVATAVEVHETVAMESVRRWNPPAWADGVAGGLGGGMGTGAA